MKKSEKIKIKNKIAENESEVIEKMSRRKLLVKAARERWKRGLSKKKVVERSKHIGE